MEEKKREAIYNRKADRNWEKKNPEHKNYLRQRSTARSFIKTKATKNDLLELKSIVEEELKTTEEGKTEMKNEITNILKEIYHDLLKNKDISNEEDFNTLLDWYVEPNNNNDYYYVESGMEYNGYDKEAYEICQTEGFKFVNF